MVTTAASGESTSTSGRPQNPRRILHALSHVGPERLDPRFDGIAGRRHSPTTRRDHSARIGVQGHEPADYVLRFEVVSGPDHRGERVGNRYTASGTEPRFPVGLASGRSDGDHGEHCNQTIVQPMHGVGSRKAIGRSRSSTVRRSRRRVPRPINRTSNCPPGWTETMLEPCTADTTIGAHCAFALYSIPRGLSVHASPEATECEEDL